MSSETKIYVKVRVLHEEIREVWATHLAEAASIAAQEAGVEPFACSYDGENYVNLPQGEA